MTIGVAAPNLFLELYDSPVVYVHVVYETEKLEILFRASREAGHYPIREWFRVEGCRVMHPLFSALMSMFTNPVVPYATYSVRFTVQLRTLRSAEYPHRTTLQYAWDTRYSPR